MNWRWTHLNNWQASAEKKAWNRKQRRGQQRRKRGKGGKRNWEGQKCNRSKNGNWRWNKNTKQEGHAQGEWGYQGNRCQRGCLGNRFHWGCQGNRCQGNEFWVVFFKCIFSHFTIKYQRIMFQGKIYWLIQSGQGGVPKSPLPPFRPTEWIKDVFYAFMISRVVLFCH